MIEKKDNKEILKSKNKKNNKNKVEIDKGMKENINKGDIIDKEKDNKAILKVKEVELNKEIIENKTQETVNNENKSVDMIEIREIDSEKVQINDKKDACKKQRIKPEELQISESISFNISQDEEKLK